MPMTGLFLCCSLCRQEPVLWMGQGGGGDGPQGSQGWGGGRKSLRHLTTETAFSINAS